MRKFNKGDVVICVKYDVGQRLGIDNTGINTITYINDTYFNRKAYISGTYKEIMMKKSDNNTDFEDKDEYQITFLDDNSTLAWVKGDELVLLMSETYGGLWIN